MQFNVWEREYRRPQLITGRDLPQNDVLRFLKYLKKTHRLKLNKLKILDLGSGTGRNANYLAEIGNLVTAMEISTTAIKIAQKRADEMNVKVRYLNNNIGARYPFPDNSFDIILDITSSNSLNECERQIYLKETYRVLKPGGHLFVRALCKDGDKNAQNLLKISPGPEPDTYIMKELGLIERVFSQKDFLETYKKFKINKLEKKKGYARMNNQSYKRIYLLAYLQKEK